MASEQELEHRQRVRELREWVDFVMAGATPEQIARGLGVPLDELLAVQPDLPARCARAAAVREVAAADAKHRMMVAAAQAAEQVARQAAAAARQAEAEARWVATVARQEAERTARQAGQWWPQWPPGL